VPSSEARRFEIAVEATWRAGENLSCLVVFGKGIHHEPVDAMVRAARFIRIHHKDAEGRQASRGPLLCRRRCRRRAVEVLGEDSDHNARHIAIAWDGCQR
jgi:hypothetical protein